MIIGAFAGTAAFILLVYAEICSCRNVKEGCVKNYPWFRTGAVLLAAGWIYALADSPKPSTLQLAIGTLLSVAAAVLYIKVLGLTSEKNNSEKSSTVKLVDTGIYAKMRHPGVWCFAILASALAIAVPASWPVSLLFTILNTVYCCLQDRFFFPVYIEGYDEYKKRVPFC